MAKKYYAVAKGNTVGVFETWGECKSQVDGVSGAKHKSFSSPQAAQSWINSINSNGSVKGTVSGRISKDGGNSAGKYGGSYGGVGSRYKASHHGNKSGSYSSNIAAKSGFVLANYNSEGSLSSKSYGTSDVSRGISKPKAAKFSISQNAYKVYTDGASRNNQSRGAARAGVGVFFGDNDPRNISKRVYGEQTNQRAELQAIEHALDVISDESKSSQDLKPYEIHSDSMYSIKALTEWSNTWKKNGWKNSKGEPVANKDVIEKCLDKLENINSTYKSRGLECVKFEHVKGHSGIDGNEKADQLAVKGAGL